MDQLVGFSTSKACVDVENEADQNRYGPGGANWRNCPEALLCTGHRRRHGHRDIASPYYVLISNERAAGDELRGCIGGYCTAIFTGALLSQVQVEFLPGIRVEQLQSPCQPPHGVVTSP
ncbi:hypothetical protein WA026_003187 [Henosepilachna vigintioctopunctata]|uniref:AMMECR1 domain-containing protein n=1 Tax=Henosepilachna vigintioctopunctata TaxID=420089 RepID=A0AAW1TN88_9CUCU